MSSDKSENEDVSDITTKAKSSISANVMKAMQEKAIFVVIAIKAARDAGKGWSG